MLPLDPTLIVLTLTTLVPFGSFVVIMVFTRRYARLSAALSITAISLSLVCALFLYIRHFDLQSPLQYTGRWLVSGEIVIPFGFLLPAELAGLAMAMSSVSVVINALLLKRYKNPFFKKKNR